MKSLLATLALTTALTLPGLAMARGDNVRFVPYAELLT